MNTNDHLMTLEESAPWNYCEGCGKALTHEHKYKYDHETGDRYADSAWIICPDFSADPRGHTRIEVIEGLVEVPA